MAARQQYRSYDSVKRVRSYERFRGILGYVPGCHPAGRDFSGCAAVLETDLAV